jgi:hypothetical protein
MKIEDLLRDPARGKLGIGHHEEDLRDQIRKDQPREPEEQVERPVASLHWPILPGNSSI